jgi:hypothetical protein
MSELSCRQCRDQAAELALGGLPSLERSRMLAHADQCLSCGHLVAALARTGERLLELLPGAEPPVGFEHRVMRALARPARVSPAAQRWWRPAAAILVTALAGALVAGGWALGRSTRAPQPPQVPGTAQTLLVAPLTSGERQVGQAYVFPGRPSWIYVSLDLADEASGATTGIVRCELVHRNGTTLPIGTFALAHGYGSWGGPAAIERESLALARVIDERGAIVATAHFAS